MEEEKGKKVSLDHLIQKIILKIKSTADKKIRAKIIRGLAQVKEAWVPSLLLELLADPSEEIRQVILAALSSRDDLPLSSVCAKLKKQPWYVKTAALQLLGQKKRPETIEAIASIIDDPNVEVRRHAAICLGNIGGQEVIPLLVKLLKDDNHYVKQAAQKSLEKSSQVRFT